MKKHIIFIFLSLFLALSCDDDPAGTGELHITTWGEEYIEHSLPSELFEDGWSVTYTSFIVSIHGFSSSENTVAGAWLVDLTERGPHELNIIERSTGSVAPVSYSVGAAEGAVNINVEATLAAHMEENALGLYVEGSATKEGTTIAFAWGFPIEAHYTECAAVERLSDGGEATVELTIHGDHLFYESLVDEEAGLRFQAIADADADQDGEVTQAELAAVSGIAFTSLDNYDVPAGSGIDNLWDYLLEQATTVGHIDGEGHCHLQ